MAPGTIGAGVTQLNLLISTALASLLPGGSVSYLYYADRLNQLPLGVVGIAVATAILPPLSRQVRTGDQAGAMATQNRGVELALLLTLPAAAALVVLAQPILAVLFQRGAFGPTETEATAAALAAYAAGRPALRLALAPALAGPLMLRLGALAGLVAAGILIFGALVLALGVTDWRELRGQLLRSRLRSFLDRPGTPR